MTTATPVATPPLAVRKTVTVQAPQAVAFEVFTARIASWWPMATHHIGKADCAAVVMEPRAGGRWFERGVDGSECDWGRVLAWEPPSRVLLAWQLSAAWAFDPAIHTEVEVRFAAGLRHRRAGDARRLHVAERLVRHARSLRRGCRAMSPAGVDQPASGAAPGRNGRTTFSSRSTYSSFSPTGAA